MTVHFLKTSQAPELPSGPIEELPQRAEAKELTGAFKLWDQYRQTARGKKPRGTLLRLLILEFLKAKPRATEGEVLEMLKGAVHLGVIETVTEDGIEWIDAKGLARDTPLSGLKQLIYRIRKKLL